jgi:hypothetical protein
MFTKSKKKCENENGKKIFFKSFVLLNYYIFAFFKTFKN